MENFWSLTEALLGFIWVATQVYLYAKFRDSWLYSSIVRVWKALWVCVLKKKQTYKHEETNVQTWWNLILFHCIPNMWVDPLPSNPVRGLPGYTPFWSSL